MNRGRKVDKLELREKINSVLQNKIEKIVVSNPIKKELGIRVDISNKQGYFMVVRYTEKQSFTSNIKEDELPQILLELIILSNLTFLTMKTNL